MVLRSMMYCGGRSRKVIIIQPDGRPRHFYSPITTRDLLVQFPGHYGLRDVAGSILPMDTELEGGNTYLLMPLKYKPQGSNSQPFHSRASWKPSLDRISENTTLLLREKEERVAKKEEIKAVKPIHRKSGRLAWERESSMSMSFLVPSGFIF